MSLRSVLLASSLAFACDTGRPADPGLGPGAQTQVVPAAIGRGLRRLSKREYDNVVRDLFGDTTRPGERLLAAEVYVNGFDNGSTKLTVQPNDVLAFQAAAEDVAARATQDPKALLGCDLTANEQPCIDAFFATFPKKAYRRPPTEGELSRLRKVYDAGKADGGPVSGLELVLETILQSPAFLYREELGAPDPLLSPSLVRLTDWELASELSFLITGSMPDDALVGAVESGRLKTPEDLRREATRLIASPAAKPALRMFLHEWMATDQIDSLAKDATVYPTFDKQLARSMHGELDRFFDDVLFGASGSLRELYTSPRGFPDASLAKLYGLPAPQTDFAPIALDAETRRGLLTRAGFLAVHADTDSSGPVPRGVFVLSALLCAPPSPPPANVPAAPPPNVAMQKRQTTRQRFDEHLNQAFCRDCHRVIDGVGFGFEQFDGIGAHRTTENGATVDTSGEINGTDIDGSFVGASELSSKLATSRQALACFTSQLYRYAMGQAADHAEALRALEGFTADSRMTDLFIALVADSSFALRTTQSHGGAR